MLGVLAIMLSLIALVRVGSGGADVGLVSGPHGPPPTTENEFNPKRRRTLYQFARFEPGEQPEQCAAEIPVPASPWFAVSLVYTPLRRARRTRRRSSGSGATATTHTVLRGAARTLAPSSGGTSGHRRASGAGSS